MRISGIYLITNVINLKKYVGCTCSSIGFNRRWNIHRCLLRHNKHPNKHLQSAWNKYGEKNFEFRILEECNDEMLDYLEQKWIKYYNSINRDFGYNIDLGGKKRNQTEETKEKISISHKNRFLKFGGRIPNKLTRKRMSKSKSGINNSFYGKSHSEETREKMRLAWEKRKLKIRNTVGI